MGKKNRNKVTRLIISKNARLVKLNGVEINEVLTAQAEKYSKLLDRDEECLYNYLEEEYSSEYGRLIHDLIQHFNDEEFSGYKKLQLIIYGPRLFEMDGDAEEQIETTPWDFKYGMFELSRNFQNNWDVSDILQAGENVQELLYEYLYSKPLNLTADMTYTPAKLHVMLTNQDTKNWELNSETIFHNKFGADKYFGWELNELYLKPTDQESGVKLPYLTKGFDVFLESLNKYIGVMVKKDPNLRFKNSDLVLPSKDYKAMINSASGIADTIFNTAGDGYHKIVFKYFDEILDKETYGSFEWNMSMGTFSTSALNIDKFILSTAPYLGLLNVKYTYMFLQSFGKRGKVIAGWYIGRNSLEKLPPNEISKNFKIKDFKPVEAFPITFDENFKIDA